MDASRCELAAAVPPESGPATSVRVPGRLPPAALMAFCRDVERLLRLDPGLVFEYLAPCSCTNWRLRGRDRDGRPFAAEATVRRLPDGLRLDYAGGPWAGHVFRVVAGENGEAGLEIVELHRDRPAGAAAAALDDWGRALQRHAAHWRRWSRFGAWRLWMEAFWLRMTPTSRRATGRALVAVPLVALVAAFTI